MSREAVRNDENAPGGISRRVRAALFFALMYVYVWLWHKPVLLYHSAGLGAFPDFRATADFAAPFFTRVAGLAGYLDAWVSQCYAASWAGALAIVGVSFALGAAVSACTAEVSGRSSAEPSYFPALVVLALCNAYVHFLGHLLALAMAVGAAAAIGRLPRPPKLLGAAAVALTALALYYAAGGVVYVFAAVRLALDLARPGRRLMGATALVAALLAPGLVGVVALREPLGEAYASLVPIRLNVVDVAACLLLALLWVGVVLEAVGAALAPRLRPRAERRVGKRRTRETAGAARSDSGLGASWARLRFAAPFLLAALVVARTDDPLARMPLEAQHLCIERRWDDVLTLARTAPEPYPATLAAAVERALLESGRISDTLFAYAPTPQDLLLCMPVSSDVDGAVYSARKTLFAVIGDVDLDLGLPSVAEAEAFEALTTHGDHPVLLKRLARIHLANSKHEAARLELRRLAQHPHQRAAVREGFARLERDLAGDPDPETARIRRRTPASDPQDLYVPGAHRAPRATDSEGPWSDDARIEPSFFTGTYVPLRIRFRTLLETDPTNRDAFELEMALYLVCRQLQDFAERIPLVADVGYERLPRHLQEAVVLCEELTGEPLDTGGLPIDPEVRRAHARFETLAAPSIAAGRTMQAREALEPEFGTTFWHYYYLER